MPSATITRRFEFVAGKSNKFWEIMVDGADVNVRFGRIGTLGQSSKKSFASEVLADQHAEKLIREKVRKGYSEMK